MSSADRAFASAPQGVRLHLGDLEIEGLSLGGLETTIAVPKWDLCFDVGRCPPFAVKRSTILVTHAHMDHAGGLAYHAAMRDLLGLQPPRYVVPRENFEAFNDLFDVWRRLDRSRLPCEIIPLSPGESVSIGRERRVDAFRSPHRVPCQGYALVSQRSRLLPEFVGLPHGRIQALVLAGTVVTEAFDQIEVVFCGDTVIDVVDREVAVRTARVLILEVTFLDGKVGVEAARSKGHVHLDEVVERADLFENEHLVFTHFSQRYSTQDVHAIIARRLPPRLRERAHVLCP